METASKGRRAFLFLGSIRQSTGQSHGQVLLASTIQFFAPCCDCINIVLAFQVWRALTVGLDSFDRPLQTFPGSVSEASCGRLASDQG